MKRETGKKAEVIWCCGNLAAFFLSLGKYSKANRYNQEALSIASEIGDRVVKASSLLIQGTIFFSIGDCVKAEEYCRESLTISKEIENRAVEARCWLCLGDVFFKKGEYVNAEEHFTKSLAISEDIGDVFWHYQSLEKLARLGLQEKRNQEAIPYLITAIEKCEKMRGSIPDNDQWKILFSDTKISSYQTLCTLLLQTGNREPALHVSELGKARALADLMSAKYSVKNQVSANPQTWSGIESVMERERNCSCLYVSYSSNSMYFWILKKGGVMHFRAIGRKEIIAHEGLVQNLEDFFCEQELQKSWHATKGAT